MGLAKNVYRRQAVYWWRRRFAEPSAGRSRTIAISLKVRRLDAARRIGDALNARAHAIAKRLELRMSSVESARQELADMVATFTWTLDEDAAAALDGLGARNAGDDADDGALTGAQERDLLYAMRREAEAELARSAACNRLRRAVDDAGDPRQEAIETELAFAVVFETIGRRRRRRQARGVPAGGARAPVLHRHACFHRARDRLPRQMGERHRAGHSGPRGGISRIRSAGSASHRRAA